MPGSSTNEAIIQPNPYAGGQPAPPISLPGQGSQPSSGGSSNNNQGQGQNTITIDDEVSLSGPSTGLNGNPQPSGPSSGGSVQPTNPGTDFNNTVPGMVPGANGSGQNQSSGNATGWWKNGNDWYYFDQVTGNMVKGWKYYNGSWYYLDPVTGIMATGWVKEGKLWYYLEPSNGHMLTDWRFIDEEWYYLETTNGNGQMIIGWKFHNGKWYYLFEDGAMAHGGWLMVGEKWYCVRDNGELEISKILEYNGKKYYVNDKGEMLTRGDTETIYYDGVTYDVDENGVCTTDDSLQNKINVFVQKGLNEHGTKESGNNITHYNNWYYRKEVSGDSYPWCSVFVLWVGNEAGILDGTIMPTLDTARTKYYEGSLTLRSWYEDKGKLYSQTSGYEPKKGDLFFKKRTSGGHVGIVVAYDPENKLVYTIEGNADDGVNAYVGKIDTSKFDRGFGVNGGTQYGTVPTDIAFIGGQGKMS